MQGQIYYGNSKKNDFWKISLLLSRTYYIREGKKSRKNIGKALPKNIEELKREFLSEIYKEKFYPLVDKIKRRTSLKNLSKCQKLLEKKTKIFSIRFTYDTQKIEGSKLKLRKTLRLSKWE